MIGWISRLVFRASYPLNLIRISQSRILSNYYCLSSLQRGIKIGPVIKSNAYGHGIAQVAKILDVINPPFFCVDSLYEALQLFKIGVKTPIIIMGYVDPRSLEHKKLPFYYAVFDLSLAKAINDFQKGAQVHLFVDTGMNREGVKLNDLEGFIKSLKKLKNINVTGLMTHLADADNLNNKFTNYQLGQFKKALGICKKWGLRFKWRHVGGSAAIFKNGLKDADVNLVRCGLAIYGISPMGESIKDDLAPALSFSTKIVQVKQVEKGEKIGYNCTFTAKRKMTVGILPAGYHDGIDRRLSNSGVVLIDGAKCPIIGRVSMNLTVVDLGKVKEPYVGQDVVVFSENQHDLNSIQNISKICKTIPYDLLVHLTPSTRREVIL